MINDEQGLFSPRNFWMSYAARLNEAGQLPETYNFYQGVGSWTPKAISIAEDVLKKDLGLKTQHEYFRVDLIGYVSGDPKDDVEHQSDWHLKVAFEHENSGRWDYELCKLCHVVCDLKVIVSYHDLRPDAKRSIKDLFYKRVRKLGLWRIHRVPNSSWLFIFGPKCVSQTYPYRAYTVDSELNTVPIPLEIEVIPDKWRR